MRILAIDPSITATGIVVVDCAGGEYHPVLCRTVRTDPSVPPSDRLNLIRTEVSAILTQNKPDLVVIEYPLFPARRVNWAAVALLWQAVGVVVSVFSGYRVVLVIPERGRTRPATKVRVEGMTEHEADAYHLGAYTHRALKLLPEVGCVLVSFSRGRVEIRGQWNEKKAKTKKQTRKKNQ